MAEGGDPEVLTRALSHDPDFDDEMKLSYAKFGVEGLMEKINAWKNQPVKIAVNKHLKLHLCQLHHCVTSLTTNNQVTGSSGCGKSSFINLLRGLTPDDEVFENKAGEEVTFQVTSINIHQARRWPTQCMLLSG